MMFRETPRFYKATCPAQTDCVANPAMVRIEEVKGTPQEVQQQIGASTDPNTIIAVNGIQNSIERGVELAFQNAVPTSVDVNGNVVTNPDKPTTIYLMHYQPADSLVGELVVAGYEKLLTQVDSSTASFLGYTNPDLAYAGALQSRGDSQTLSLGHSRGTIVQLNAFNLLNQDGYSNSQLSARAVGGAMPILQFTDAATQVVGKDNNKNITFNYYSNDPVSTLVGGNPGDTGVTSLRNLWTVMTGGNNSQHSCYGTGTAGCTQVEIPMPGDTHPQGTADGNAKLIRYQGGVQVDASGEPIKQ